MPVNESLVANPSSEELRIYRRQLYDARTHNHQRLLACMVAFYLWQNSFSQSSPIKLSRWLILLNWDADWKDLSESDVNCNHCFFFSYNGIVWETCLRLTVYAIMKRVFSPLHMSMFRPVTVLLRAFLRTFLKIPSQLKDWSILGNGVSSYHVLKISTKPEHRLCIDLAWRDTKTYYLEINLKPVFFVHCSFF